jgi:uncharacterized RDD family membrane protein YckC
MRMDESPEAAPRPAAYPAAPAWRLLALVYDALPLIPIVLGVSALFLWLNGGRTVEHNPLLQWTELLATWLLAGAYFVVSWKRGGQTMGMRPWRLRVVCANGRPPSLRALWLRYAAATLTPVVGLLWAFFDADRRALYDLAAGTSFVRLRPKTGSDS